MATHSLSLSVSATTAAVTTVRREAVAGIRRWRAEMDEDTVHTAALVISELVTNAVKHADTYEVSLLVQLAGPVLRIEVHDSSPELPQPGHPDMNSENGRGLLLVAALADHHGTERTETGKCCWAELTLPAPVDPADLPPPFTKARPKETAAAPRPRRAAEGARLPPPHSLKSSPDIDGLRRGYWCECRTEDQDKQRQPTLIASLDAHSAAQADNWIAVTLRTITPALDADASDEAWDRLYGSRIETRRALLRSEPCTMSVTQARRRITWTIRPVLFLPLAHREGVELPACAYDFSPTQPCLVPGDA